MGTVLPPWKLELIEKKRKRLEQEKAKEQEKIERYSSIPEWKRNILSKRKGGQNDDSFTNTQAKANLSIDDQTTTNAKKQTESSHIDGRSSNSDTSSSNERVITNERLRNGDLDGHSTVSSVAQSDKQRQEHTELSNESPSQDDSDSDDDNIGRVLYEHIKTPSELRRLYELQVAKKKAIEEVKLSKENSISNRAKSSQGSVYSESQVSKTLQNRDTTTAKSLHSTDAKPNGSIPKEDISKQVQIFNLNDEESVQERAPPVKEEITQLHATDDNNDNDLQNGQDPSAEIHVKTIRNKFGPSGFFRRRSASSDNLLKSLSEPATPTSSPKPRSSKLNKRWSMVALPRSGESSAEFSPPATDPLKRARSLSDVKSGEHNEVPSLKHRASVSHDIEHRIHELSHHMCVSDGNTSDEWDDDQIFPKEKPTSSPVVTEHDDKPKERRASWFTSEDIDKAAKSVHVTHLPQGEKSSQSTTSSNHAKSDNLAKETNNLINQKTSVSGNSGNISTKREVIQEKQINADNAEKSESFKHDLHDSGIDITDENTDETEKGPSVHKLSALFGSSIAKGTKSKQSILSKNEPKQSKPDTSNKSENKGSVKFPWMKKSSNDVSNKEATGSKFPFKGAQNLKPVQKKYSEQKITGNMTLVTGGNKSNQSYNHVKPSNYSNSLKPTVNSAKNPTTSIRTIRKPSVDDEDDEYITIIDVPDMTSNDDIEVSAIDIPEPPSPTPVSVIDMPAKKETGVKVSVIDVPEDSDSDSDSGTTGSYDVNSGSTMFTFNSHNSESIEEEEEEEEDIDNVPVSYFGDSTYMKVPEVIFESEREDVKSILSSPLRKRKKKNKVVFHKEKLENVHDYPSEVCLQSHYDQMSKDHSGLSSYQPTALQNINLSVHSLKPVGKNKDENANNKVADDAVKITYSDEGEGFSNTSSSTGALLF